MLMANHTNPFAIEPDRGIQNGRQLIRFKIRENQFRRCRMVQGIIHGQHTVLCQLGKVSRVLVSDKRQVGSSQAHAAIKLAQAFEHLSVCMQSPDSNPPHAHITCSHLHQSLQLSHQYPRLPIRTGRNVANRPVVVVKPGITCDTPHRDATPCY